MRRLIVGLLITLGALGCGGSGGITAPPPPGKKALDPYLTVRMRSQLDTATPGGRSHWHIFLLITTPLHLPSTEGVTRWGAISLVDLRLQHGTICGNVASDSIGARLISLLAVADTTTESLTADATAESIADAWFAGNHTPPSGWKAIVVAPTDPWDSQQWAQGHGLTRDDPIRWGWDWTGSGGSSFYERPPADDSYCNAG
jgi:hypothetical protein